MARDRVWIVLSIMQALWCVGYAAYLVTHTGDRSLWDIAFWAAMVVGLIGSIWGERRRSRA